MADLFEGAPNPCRLLVIAPDEFADALSSFILHKNRTGMPAHLVRLSDIVVASSDPATHPLAIKRVILRGHEEFGVAYVMLAGDASKIPVRHRFIRQPDGGAREGMMGTYNPTDNYYANLYRPGGRAAGFSNWDDNRDGKYNEQIWSQSPVANNPDHVDGFPHVAVGRVPAHTPQDIINYVRKVIEYEEGLRVRSINSFCFLADNDAGLNSRQKCDDVISFSNIEAIPNAEVRRLQANLPPEATAAPNWNRFGSAATEHAAFTAKWLIHFGHGDNSSWVISLDSRSQINDPYVRTSGSGGSYSYPVVLSVGCDTGQFLNWAPQHRYRGLNPDQDYHFWFPPSTPPMTVEERIHGGTWGWPIDVPTPHSYDFPNESARTFAYAWLCANSYGGAIAYMGATQVHQGTQYGAHLAARLCRAVANLNTLGDIWAQAQRDYFADIADVVPDRDSEFGSPRIYLCVQTLFGDPSVRLSPVTGYGVSVLMANDRLTVFARTAHGTLTHKFFDRRTQQWTEWMHLGDGQLSSGPGAVMAGERLTVFARTAHGTLTHKFFDVQQQIWTQWAHFEGGEISSAPSAVMAGTRLVVFARTTRGLLVHRFFDQSQQVWTPWMGLGEGEISSAPSAVMAGNRLTVFARTMHGTLTHKFFDPERNAWTDWIHLGEGQISSAPSAVMAGDRLTVFARTMHGTLTHKFFDPRRNAWSDWIHLGEGQISSAPSAVMAGDRLTVFARTLHGTLTHKFFDSPRNAWTDWMHLGEGQIT
jgi:hypothetical protein